MAVTLAEPTVLAAAKDTLYPDIDTSEPRPVRSHGNAVHAIHVGRVDHSAGAS